MADIAAQSPIDYGNLINSFARNQAGIANTNAQTALTQQQATGAAIQNQQAAISLNLYEKAIAGIQQANGDQSGVAQSGQSDGDANFNPAHIDAGLRNRFFVDPSGSPAEKQLMRTAALSGNPGLQEYAKQQRDLGVQSRVAQNQKDAGNLYDAMSAVTTAPDGLAFDILSSVSPTDAAALRKDVADPDARDAAARNFALHVSQASHAYTGRPVEAATDGSYRDKVTGQPVIGVRALGLSPDQWAQIAKAGMDMTDVPQSDGSTLKLPRWQANGAPSLESWMRTVAVQHGAVEVSPQVTGSAISQEAGKNLKAAADNARKASADANGGKSPSVTSTDPAMTKALQDTDYRIPTPRTRVGVSQAPADLENQKNILSSQKELYADAGSAVKAAAQSMTYLKAAQSILETKGATIGAYGGLVASASRWSPWTGDATNYQELAKYLGNAALYSAKGLFPKITQSEVQLQLHELSPSVHMTDATVRDLLQTNIKNAQYAIDSAHRVRPYLMARNDPQSFGDWNQKYFPQEKIVNDTNTSPAGPAIGTVSKGYRYNGGDPSKPSSWAKVSP